LYYNLLRIQPLSSKWNNIFQDRREDAPESVMENR